MILKILVMEDNNNVKENTKPAAAGTYENHDGDGAR